MKIAIELKDIKNLSCGAHQFIFSTNSKKQVQEIKDALYNYIVTYSDKELPMTQRSRIIYNLAWLIDSMVMTSRTIEPSNLFDEELQETFQNAWSSSNWSNLEVNDGTKEYHQAIGEIIYSIEIIGVGKE